MHPEWNCLRNLLFGDVHFAQSRAHSAGLRFPHSDPKALHMGLTPPIYSTFGLELAHVLRAWSAGGARTTMCKLTLRSVLSKGLTELCCRCAGLSLQSKRDCSYLPNYSIKHLNRATTAIACTGTKARKLHSFVLLWWRKLSSIAFQAAKCPASSTLCLSAHDNFISTEL